MRTKDKTAFLVHQNRHFLLKNRLTIENNLRFLSNTDSLTDEQFLRLFLRMFLIYDEILTFGDVDE